MPGKMMPVIDMRTDSASQHSISLNFISRATKVWQARLIRFDFRGQPCPAALPMIDFRKPPCLAAMPSGKDLEHLPYFNFEIRESDFELAKIYSTCSQ